MSDFLKESLYFDAVPTVTEVDTNATGISHANFGSAAESHDANDSTKFTGDVPGDSDVVNGLGEFHADAVLTTSAVSTAVTFVRVRIRAQRTHAGAGASTASVQARIGGVSYGADHVLSTSLAWYESDFSTDPLDSGPWSADRINGQDWGFRAAGATDDPSGTCIIDVTEFEVLVYMTDPVATPTGASGGGVAQTPEGSPGIPDGATVAVQVATLDSGSVPAVIRSFKASLGDQTTTTADVHTTTGTGTQLQPLYGAASQGVVGSSGAGNGIKGTGTISGIKLFAIIRVSKQASASITNVRFGTAMGLKSLVTPAVIQDYDQPLTDDMWQTVETALITEGAFAVPFEWGNGTNSVWSNMFGWTMNYTYSGSGTKQLEVAEAWVEVHGPTGADEGSTIRLELPVNLPPKVIEIQAPL